MYSAPCTAVADQLSGGRLVPAQSAEAANAILQRERSGYRIVAGEVSPIIDGDQIVEIERAAVSPFEGVNTHIRRAPDLLGKHPNPDHRNASKEAMSAVESAVGLIGDVKSGGHFREGRRRAGSSSSIRQ